MLLVYSSTQRGYKCYSPSLCRVFVSTDVMFVECQSYFPKLSLRGETLGEEESWDDLDLTNDTPTPLSDIESDCATLST